MALESCEVVGELPATPEAVYAAWMDAAGHAAMTGADATVDPAVGGRFTAWDGYIAGATRALEPGRLIVQDWRTTEFAPTDADSRLEVELAPVAGGTRVSIRHTGIPAGQGADYERGWDEYYLTPMRAYFAGR